MTGDDVYACPHSVHSLSKRVTDGGVAPTLATPIEEQRGADVWQDPRLATYVAKRTTGAGSY